MIITAKPKLTLADCKIQRKLEVDRKRIEIMDAGIMYQGSLFDTDLASLRNISYWHLQINSGFVLPPDFIWRDNSNIDHPADNAFVLGLSLAITARGTFLYQVAWGHKAFIDAASTVLEILAYDINSGWTSE
jgi:hypothetical protein